MGKRVICRDPRVSITKVKRSYKTKSGFRYAEEIGLFSSEKEDVVCPRCLSERVRKYGKGEAITRWDLLQKGKGVGRVTLQSQLWACGNCRNWKFRDPHFPYEGKGTTTADFDRWVSQQLAERPETFQTEFASRFDLPVSTINRIVNDKLKRAEDCVMCAVPVKELWVIPFHYQKSDCLMAVGRGIADVAFCERNGMDAEGYVLLGVSKGRELRDLKDASRLVLTELLERVYCPEELISPELVALCEVVPYHRTVEPEEITQLLVNIHSLHNQKVAYNKLLLLLLHNEQARMEEWHFDAQGYFSDECYAGYVCRCLTGKQANYSFSDLARWADEGVHYFCVDVGRLLQFMDDRTKGKGKRANV